MSPDGSGCDHSFIHSSWRYLLSSASDIGDVIGAGADAKADYSPSYKKLIILEGINGDIFSYKSPIPTDLNNNGIYCLTHLKSP